MRSKRVVWLVCVLLLGLSLPGRALESPVKMDFKSMLQGFLAFLEGDTSVAVGGGCPVTVTCPSGGVTLQCTGTTCVKEDKRCVKCDKSSQFCPGTTGTNCGTSTPSSSEEPIGVGEGSST
jgi:hypothetical protein